jgi:two-component system alkaline phosphatase synthesis response regulator PhoP
MSRILVVEDEATIARALEDDFRSQGYGVELAADGRTAFEKARTNAFDLVVLDVMLPGKDGFDVCRDLRRAGIRTPILMLTARTHEAEKVLGLELGADDYVTKPYSRRELQARVKALLRRSADAPPETCRFGDVEVDFARGEIRRGGRIVEVTPLEFRVLAAFVRHPGRVLTRQQLLDEAWGRDLFVTDRVVDNQVTNLRKKIEPDPSHPRYVVTVAGQGYRLDGSR